MASRTTKRNKVEIDLSFLNAATILARQSEYGSVVIMLVGCGGTGSFMAMHIGRLLRALNDAGKKTRAVFVDHDLVETQNIGRQLFCDAELGANKASALALRYGTAWGLDIVAVPERFTAKTVPTWCPDTREDLLVMVGCVDNAAARRELNKALKRNEHGHERGCRCAPSIWWLDCGNHSDTGQVVLGSTLTKLDPKTTFPSKTICQALPSPALQHPELLKARPEETPAKKKMSCAELTAANLQSLNINNRVAAEAGDMLTRLLMTRDLKRFKCDINLVAGSVRSTYATPENVCGGVVA